MDSLGVPFKLAAYDCTPLGVVYVPLGHAETLRKDGRCMGVAVETTKFSMINSTTVNFLSESVVSMEAGRYFYFELIARRGDSSLELFGCDPEHLDNAPGFAFLPGVGFAAWRERRDAEREASRQRQAERPVDPGPYLRAAREAV